MTRINANIHPASLLDQHLMAEYRELPMVYAALTRSLKTKSLTDVLRAIPKEFTLNTGHVKFFYNKLKFLDQRYALLKVELLKRGYTLDVNRNYSLTDFPSILYNDWKMNDTAFKTITERILLRYNQKPQWYKYYGDKVDPSFVENLLR
jgi:deoxyribonuclease (pyrimidine dimer)